MPLPLIAGGIIAARFLGPKIARSLGRFAARRAKKSKAAQRAIFRARQRMQSKALVSRGPTAVVKRGVPSRRSRFIRAAGKEVAITGVFAGGGAIVSQLGSGPRGPGSNAFSRQQSRVPRAADPRIRGQTITPRRKNVARSSTTVMPQFPDQIIVDSWEANGTPFVRFANGMQAAQRKDGTWKKYRPYRPVVIPKKWNAKSMGRVARELDRQKKTAIAIVRLTGGEAYATRRRSS